MKHEVGSFTIPKTSEIAAFTDGLVYRLGQAIKGYVNQTLGEAYSEVNHNDPNVIRNVRCVPSVHVDATIRAQLPALFIYRETQQRQPFTHARDWLFSDVIVQYVAEIADSNVEKQYAIFSYIPAAIESMLRRVVTFDGYELLDYLDCEDIELVNAKTQVLSTKGQQQVSVYGYYSATIKLRVSEVVEPAEEDIENLENIGIVIDLQGDNDGLDGYEQYPLEDFDTIDIGELDE